MHELELELELELIQTHMTQKPMQRVEVCARCARVALRASQNAKEEAYVAAQKLRFVPRCPDWLHRCFAVLRRR